MSCILYSKGAYNQLELNSQLAREIFSPLAVAEFLFELNADAYKVRYGHHEEIDTEIREAREEVESDSEFQLSDWNDATELHNLMGRIRYQCSDIYDKGEESANPDHIARYQVLEAVIAELERRMTNPAYKLEQARKRGLQREQAAQQKEIDKARIIGDLKTKYPWAKEPKPSKNLKKELTLAFPGVKFSVRSDYNSIDVTWTDGPTSEQVDEIASKYKSGNFDGMTDSFDHDSSAYGSAVSAVLGRVRYVFSHRKFSQRFLRDAVIEVCFEYGHNTLPVVKTHSDGSAWLDGGQIPLCPGGDAYGYNSLHDAILRHAHETSTFKLQVKQEVKEEAPAQSDEYTVTPSGSWTWVKFAAKPSANVISSLKAAGAKWSMKRQAWYFAAPVSLSISDDVVTIAAR